jgi:hypothetical protein
MAPRSSKKTSDLSAMTNDELMAEIQRRNTEQGANVRPAMAAVSGMTMSQPSNSATTNPASTATRRTTRSRQIVRSDDDDDDEEEESQISSKGKGRAPTRASTSGTREVMDHVSVPIATSSRASSSFAWKKNGARQQNPTDGLPYRKSYVTCSQCVAGQRECKSQCGLGKCTYCAQAKKGCYDPQDDPKKEASSQGVSLSPIRTTASKKRKITAPPMSQPSLSSSGDWGSSFAPPPSTQPSSSSQWNLTEIPPAVDDDTFGAIEIRSPAIVAEQDTRMVVSPFADM